MIPVMIITFDKRCYNYFDGLWIDRNIQESIYHIVNVKSDDSIYQCDNEKEIEEVLELLHKEVANCFEGGKFQKLFQTKFQIYLKDIIEKAKEELNNE